MNCYRIRTSPDQIDTLWYELTFLGVTPLYSEEEGNSCVLFVDIGEIGVDSLYSRFPENTIEKTALPETDWEKQWTEHCPGYQTGEFLVHLSEYGREGELMLEPGGGFGDLSHPTTRLVLSMMSHAVDGQTVIDLGCGSGILSLAALRWGAQHAYAIDIDPVAIAHTQSNAQLNGLVKITTSLPCDMQLPTKDSILFCNMIRSEQEIAWSTLLQHSHHISHAFISGILEEEFEQYLKLSHSRGWSLVNKKSLEGWLGLEFRTVTQ